MVEAASETMSSKMTRFFHVCVILFAIFYPGSALPNYVCTKTLPENDPNLGIKRVNSLYQFETNDTLCQYNEKKDLIYIGQIKDGKYYNVFLAYYGNGSLLSEKHSIEGNNDGFYKLELSKTYYRNGKLKQEALYNNEIHEGFEKEYYESGQLESERLYKNGKTISQVKGYYKNGKLKSETPYQDGEIEGVLKVYYESGQLKSVTPYKNGHKDGLEKEYYENGQLKKEIPYSYHHDKEFEKEFCECERPKSEINGVVKEYHDNGNLASETRYEDSQKEGSGKYYDKNNKFSVTISYQLDKAVSGICRSRSGRVFPLTNTQIMNWNNGLATGCE